MGEGGGGGDGGVGSRGGMIPCFRRASLLKVFVRLLNAWLKMMRRTIPYLRGDLLTSIT